MERDKVFFPVKNQPFQFLNSRRGVPGEFHIVPFDKFFRRPDSTRRKTIGRLLHKYKRLIAKLMKFLRKKTPLTRQVAFQSRISLRFHTFQGEESSRFVDNRSHFVRSVFTEIAQGKILSCFPLS